MLKWLCFPSVTSILQPPRGLKVQANGAAQPRNRRSKEAAPGPQGTGGQCAEAEGFEPSMGD